MVLISPACLELLIPLLPCHRTEITGIATIYSTIFKKFLMCLYFLKISYMYTIYSEPIHDSPSSNSPRDSLISSPSMSSFIINSFFIQATESNMHRAVGSSTGLGEPTSGHNPKGK